MTFVLKKKKKKKRDLFTALDMLINLQFFLCLLGVFLIFLRFQFQFCTLLFIYIEYLTMCQVPGRDLAILSMKLLSLRLPMVSYLSNPVAFVKPSLALTLQFGWLSHSSKNNILPQSSTHYSLLVLRLS